MTTTTTKFNTYKINDTNQGDKIKWSFYLYFIKHYCKYILLYNTIEAHASPHRRVLNEMK